MTTNDDATVADWVNLPQGTLTKYLWKVSNHLCDGDHKRMCPKSRN